MKQMQTAALAVLGFVTLISLVFLVSVVTTYGIHDARIRPGTWVFAVKTADGVVLSDAELLVIDKAGQRDYQQVGTYQGPGSIRADENGVLRFRLDGSYGYGGWSVRVFWVWPVSRVPHPAMRITAPGYEAQDFRFDRPSKEVQVVHLRRQY